jgi:KDO2-lipid IV(A) lauroyltransferase
VIRQNIARSFPDLSKAEQEKIVKGFYRHFCDILVEAIKGFTISKKSLMKRYVCKNPEILKELYDKGQDVIAVGAHYANWEWGILAAPMQVQHKFYAFYTPLRNKSIDRFLRNNRSRWGSELLSIGEVKKAFNAADEKPVIYFFGADQSPSNVKSSHWMEFLNQDTPCMKGPEFFARHYDLPVLYFDVQRIRKGYYVAEIKILESYPAKTSKGEITEKYMRTLEQIIRNKPENYLWSHRRWKHSRK